MRYDVEVNGRRRQVNVHRTDGRFIVHVDDQAWTVDVSRINDQMLSLIMVDGGHSHEVTFAADPGTGTTTVSTAGVPMAVSLNGRRRGPAGDAGSGGSGPQRLIAPMPGKVVKVLVKPGDLVKARQPLVVIEAMKMENELRSGRDGRVAEIAVRDGQSVDAGMLLAVIADG
jgi:biotin carboxyl carrier protein